MFYVGGRGFVRQINEPVTFARCALRVYIYIAEYRIGRLFGVIGVISPGGHSPLRQRHDVRPETLLLVERKRAHSCLFNLPNFHYNYLYIYLLGERKRAHPCLFNLPNFRYSRNNDFAVGMYIFIMIYISYVRSFGPVWAPVNTLRANVRPAA